MKLGMDIEGRKVKEREGGIGGREAEHASEKAQICEDRKMLFL